MTTTKRRIDRSDILDLKEYGAIRRERRAMLVEVKRLRRVPVGPDATFYFENYETMWSQIHEMLFIEKGGEEQIEDELRAYNPLIPQGDELVATLMFEIDDPRRRAAVLGRLTGVEDTVSLQIDGEAIPAESESEVERTKADGKTSSIHFLRFHLTPAQIAKFRDPAVPVLLGIEHAHYGHLARLSPDVRSALAKDFA
ncbi:DUF3501 family protein [Zavarzinia sp. CC-PAN008]|uniref:DUF3501 family protein n=1 Tax=Zavarzinia sp. CC-PAN008 TaxID=3243332 RepID=UPI003F745E5A